MLQSTPEETWTIAVSVVSTFPGAITGAPIDEQRIRATAAEMGLGPRIDDVLSVWWQYTALESTLGVVAQVRAAGIPCFLATNQDAYRAMHMREKTPFRTSLDGSYYSCDIGFAKPSTAFFEHIAADLDLLPGELLFLDDQAANVSGAQAAGLNAERWTHNDGTNRLREVLANYGIHLDGLPQHGQSPTR